MSRRLILDIAVSLDGRIEGPDGALDWLRFDDETARFTNEHLVREVGAILYGRKAFERFGAQQPDGATSEAGRTFQAFVARATKYVVSRTIAPRDAGGAVVLAGDAAEEVQRLRSGTGAPIWLCGGAQLIQTCLRQRLIDEYRLTVHPVVLGTGLKLFGERDEVLELTLTSSHTLRNGLVAVCYKPRPAPN